MDCFIEFNFLLGGSCYLDDVVNSHKPAHLLLRRLVVSTNLHTQITLIQLTQVKGIPNGVKVEFCLVILKRTRFVIGLKRH